MVTKKKNPEDLTQTSVLLTNEQIEFFQKNTQFNRSEVIREHLDGFISRKKALNEAR